MKTEITVTGYKVAPLIGWMGLCIGFWGGVAQYFHPSVMWFAFLVLGLVGGGITITFSGPLEKTTKRRIQLHPFDAADHTRK